MIVSGKEGKLCKKKMLAADHNPSYMYAPDDFIIFSIICGPYKWFKSSMTILN